ncbi:CapA family protein, partial [Oscillatoriales cyanobacterium LEGE 11467]
MTAYMDILGQPSSMELARSGHFQEIAYWLNQFLIPQGIYARVSAAGKGCLRILVELPPQQASSTPRPSISRKKQLVGFICHQIWQLNSDAIEGVRIAARPAGQSEILWKQSVRISTPANRERKHSRATAKLLLSSIESIRSQIRANYKTLRVLLLTGAAASAFAIGVWLSSQQLFASRSPNSIPFPQPPTVSVSSTSPSAISPPLAKEVGMVDTALERVSVVEHAQVLDPRDPTVSLMFAGDVTLSEGEDNDLSAFAAMEEIAQVDVAAINLEQIFTREASTTAKTATYKSAPESVDFLSNSGIDLVNLANDRVMEYGEAGLLETLETLDRAGIYRVGAGRDATEARRPTILEVKGQKIAYLGYYAGDSNSAGKDKAGTNKALKDRIARDIEAIRDRVDWTIVNFHWGAQLAETPDRWQVDLAHFTIDNGADLIVGHHAKVLQGAQIYKDRAIAYSLGNFIFGGSTERRYDTAVLKVLLKGSQMKVEFLPVEVRDFQPKVVRGRRGRQILRQLEERSEMFDRPMPASALLKRQPRKPNPETNPETNPEPKKQKIAPALPSDSSKFPRSQSISAPSIPTDIDNGGESDISQPWKSVPTFPKLMSSPQEEDDSDTFIRDP